MAKKVSKGLQEKKYARVIDYKNVFENARGRRVINDLIDTHFLLRSTFDPDRPQLQAFREGERNVVLRILSILRIDPTELQKNIKEIDEDE